MSKLNIFLMILDMLIIFSALTYIMFKVNMEKLNNNKHRLIDSEADALKTYKKKHELLVKIIDMTQTKYKTSSKVFDEVKELDITSLESFKNEKLLNKCYKEVLQIREDNAKVRETKAYKQLLKDYNQNEILLVSLRSDQ